MYLVYQNGYFLQYVEYQEEWLEQVGLCEFDVIKFENNTFYYLEADGSWTEVEAA